MGSPLARLSEFPLEMLTLQVEIDRLRASWSSAEAPRSDTCSLSQGPTTLPRSDPAETLLLLSGEGRG